MPDYNLTAALFHLGGVLERIRLERVSQWRKWGDQTWRPQTDEYMRRFGRIIEQWARISNDERDEWTWGSILLEEVGEALRLDPDKDRDDLIAELVQVATVAAAWIEALEVTREK